MTFIVPCVKCLGRALYHLDVDVLINSKRPYVVFILALVSKDNNRTGVVVSDVSQRIKRIRLVVLQKNSLVQMGDDLG